MKLNNKGFAISVLLYSMVILIMGIMYLLLDIINDRYRLTKELKENVVEYINSQGINTVSNEYASKIAINKVISSKEMVFNKDNGNYYYSGANPNNYVRFNNELWRIIGVISVNGVNYLKIVRKDSIKEETASDYHIVDSNIFAYLNDNYYQTMNISRTMIKKINWYNSEYPSTITRLNAFHEEEVATFQKQGYVGLINGSDFGYAASDDYHDYFLDNYAPSINDNWLALTISYFTMNFNGTKINVINNGNFETTDNMTAHIFPCVYLKKDVLISSGTGTEYNPYILSN